MTCPSMKLRILFEKNWKWHLAGTRHLAVPTPDTFHDDTEVLKLFKGLQKQNNWTIEQCEQFVYVVLQETEETSAYVLLDF